MEKYLYCCFICAKNIITRQRYEIFNKSEFTMMFFLKKSYLCNNERINSTDTKAIVGE